ncbi:F-type H+-transporting ATPase subunit epsilon [Promicromonospora umidemergens]|uniref:ATP synthase F1 complex delta/epsilon subunit N-terminal domain-containing protein n=1 Tax=Promicromonospora umidemergens TaxID=629679 RepID=A0ABP8YAY2_9MICO|nr:F0F1 ATP synthase subunit epsilon [Promicromonospora umidemergens]MCP2284726.1 F-type H+-transporting ATPase subunit epsilon [Promicromonospora umidemergens]
MAELSVDLVSRDRKVWSGTATQVSAPSADGQIGILANHTPLLAVLRPGAIKVETASGPALEAQVTGGFVSVDNNLVTLVVDEISLV